MVLMNHNLKIIQHMMGSTQVIFSGQMAISYFRSPSDIFRLDIFWNLTLGNLRLIRWQIQGEFCCYRQFSTS